MKSTQNRRIKTDKKKILLDKSDDTLAVLRDVSSGKEYYLSIIDSFTMGQREYVAMYNYEPDDGNHADPELVIMRTEFAKTGEQVFYSIRNKKELDATFRLFAQRFSSARIAKGMK